ncbi:MAG: hypothetical protein CVU39_25490 [Chloroflexi bacterium HGW-Chloroflexi-10]|nr:MAG: hypothetical protein CVU39_25490 [Chloroflexi bacterium HGW-Chloroflexi-10]
MTSKSKFLHLLILPAFVLALWSGTPVAASNTHHSAEAGITNRTDFDDLPPDLQEVFESTVSGATAQGKLSVYGAPYDDFGQSVALSADGNTVVVGAPNTDLTDMKDVGVAYIFVRDSGVWEHQATLSNQSMLSPDINTDVETKGGTTIYFGQSVSISDDGNTVLVGAPNSGGFVDQGIAVIFTRSGDTWTHLTTLVAGDAAEGDGFGYSVALSGDGLAAVIGTPGADIDAKEDQGAAYLFTNSASTWSQQRKFTASDGAAGDEFGTAISISDNGGTVVAGAPSAKIGSNIEQGAVYIFMKFLNSWTPVKITASAGEADDLFGRAVAVNGGGSKVVIGAYGDFFSGAGNAAYVYMRAGLSWGGEQKITTPGSSRFGRSVAINDNASRVLIGSTWDKINENTRQGAAYVFDLVDSTWALQDRLVAADGLEDDWLGISAALSDDGEVSFVGTVGIDIAGNSGQGAVYAFTPGGSDWSQTQKLTGACAPNFQFGFANALSGDGLTAIIGAPSANLEGVTDQGAAYIYTRSGPVWVPQARLVASDGLAGDKFGYSVSISDDGNTAIVGAYWATVGANAHQGKAYIFTRTGTTWSEKQILTVAGAVDDWFGLSVAINGDGDLALIGAIGRDVNGKNNQGAAYTFSRSGDTWSYQALLMASDGLAGDTFGRSADFSQDGTWVIIGTPGATVDGKAMQGAAYIFTNPGSGWSQQKKLTTTAGAAHDELGISVSISNDGSIALVGAQGEEADMGRAYIFRRTASTWTQERQFTISGGLAGDHVGFSTALSGDGRIALVGAYGTDEFGKQDKGMAYLFVKQNGSWSAKTILSAADGAANDQFGFSVALSADGNTALIGARNNAMQGHNLQGAVYPYALNYPTQNELYLPLLVR